MNKLNEKRIEIPNPYPVKMEEIIDLVERSTRLIHTTTDSKTNNIQLYIYSTGRDRPDYLAEVEITSAGYILHDDDGFYYQGSTFKEFQNDLREVVFHFEAVVFKRLGENIINKEQLFNNILNEAETTKYMACCYDPEDYYEETNYIDEDGELNCNSSGAKLFNTEDEAIEYADEIKPIGWMSFAMPFNITLNEFDDNYKAKRLKETFDSTSAAFNLTKLKGYLRFETDWDYDEDYPEDAMLIDKVHEPPRFTVNWIGPEGEKHPNTYCVRTLRDRGESSSWEIHYFLKASDAAEMINLEVGTWEHNNEFWKFN